MRRAPILTAACVLAGLVSSVSAAELWVDASAAGGGNGSADKPFQSINEALKKAIGGDTVTIRKGTYAEIVNLKLSGTPQKPTVLRAAPGERVILSFEIFIESHMRGDRS